MPPAPATQAGKPPAGKKILGMSRGQLGIVVLIAAGGILYLVWRARQKSSASSSTSSSGTSTGTCPDGSTPDANGNCPQNSQDFSGQLATLQQEIADLQASAGGGGSSGGGSSDGGGSTGSSGSQPPPPPTGGGSTPTGSGGNLPAGQGTGQPQQVTKYPAPTGLSARADNPTTIAVSWNPTSPPAQSYTLAVYQMNGKEVHSGSVGGVSSGKVSTAVSGLHPTWQYQVHVWANGGSQAPPHATTIVTMPKG